MRIFHFTLNGLACLALVFSCASCGVGGGGRSSKRVERVMYQWRDDGGEGKVSIRISLADQIAVFDRGGREIGWCYVATGKEGHGTSPGDYKITEKIEDKYSNRYGWMEDEFGNVVDGDAKYTDRVPEGLAYVPAPMPYWMRITSYGIGMHGGLIPEPGKPASHGCIRMPKQFVPFLFEAVDVGTSVEITRRSIRSAAIPEAAPPPVEPRPTASVAPKAKPQRAYRGDGRVISTRPLTESELQRMGLVPGTRVREPFTTE
jgi:hypothetical protein